MPTKSKPRPITAKQSLAIAIVCAVMWIVQGSTLMSHARRNDFLNLYTGASMALHGNWNTIYTEAGQLAREQEFMPSRKVVWPFVRPPAYAVIMAPLALLPFGTAFWVWIFGQSTALAACWIWAWRRFGPESVIWGVFMIFGPLGIAHGQDCALYLAVLTGAFALAEKKRFFASGLALGLGMVKFHLFLLWPLVLLFQKRWRMFAGLSTCVAAQLTLSFWLIGWSGLRHYADFILHLTAFYSPDSYINIEAILLNLGLSSTLLLTVLRILLAGLILWAARRRQPLWTVFALATAGSLAIGPHVYAYDGTMMLLPAWCVIYLSAWPVSRLAAATICTPLTAAATLIGPPVACFTAAVILLLATALCLESRRAPVPAEDRVAASDPAQPATAATPC